MSDNNQTMEIQEQEVVEHNGSEPMRSQLTFVPRADIYETEEDVVIMLDMPGTGEDSIDITLENHTLTINGMSNHTALENHTLVFAEYRPGDYERSFRLNDQIDREKIAAKYQDGVLKLTLPKLEQAKVRKITVNTK